MLFSILRRLINFLQENEINVSTNFRLLICGSDQWTMEEYFHTKRIFGDNIRLINSYGVTEATIDSTYFEESNIIDNTSLSTLVPIGKPFPHVNIHILNDQHIPVNSDEIGEIYIGGEGVTSGYFNDPQQTENNFLTINNIKLYKTGDMGKYLPDGNILFLGRNHGYIKINGKRVDTLALEMIINKHPKIKQSIISSTQSQKKTELICYIVTNDQSITHKEFIEYVKSNFCYPLKKIYLIDEIPLTPNGKIDRSISAQKIIKELSPEYTPANKSFEKRLVTIWQQILERVDIGIHNCFFDLGGSSLMFASMIQEINKEFNINISCSTCASTIKNLSDMIHNIVFSVSLPPPSSLTTGDAHD